MVKKHFYCLYIHIFVMQSMPTLCERYGWGEIGSWMAEGRMNRADSRFLVFGLVFDVKFLFHLEVSKKTCNFVACLT